MTGGNSFYRSVRAVHRGVGFYTAVAFSVDLIIIVTLLSSYCGSTRRARPAIIAPLPAPQRVPVPGVRPGERGQSPPAPREAAPPPGDKISDEDKEAATPEYPVEDEQGTDAALSREESVSTGTFRPLEGFIDGRINRGGPVRSYGRSGGMCTAEVVASPERPDGCLRLTYDVAAATAAAAGYFYDLNGMDLAPYRLLTFQVKKQNGSEPFAVELSDGVHTGRVEINRLLSEEAYSGWQTVTIPLEYFSGVTGRDRMQGRISIVFEYCQGEPYAGTVYLRKIGFER
jgi:hypothetical protein